MLKKALSNLLDCVWACSHVVNFYIICHFQEEYVVISNGFPSEMMEEEELHHHNKVIAKSGEYSH